MSKISGNDHDMLLLQIVFLVYSQFIIISASNVMKYYQSFAN